jgi:hypothetical protein
MTDLRVVIAGPTGTVPESRVRHHRGGYSVGRMHQMIGPGTRAYVHHWQVRAMAGEKHADFIVIRPIISAGFRNNIYLTSWLPALCAYFRIAGPKLPGQSGGR